MSSATCFDFEPPSSWRGNTKGYKNNTSTNNAKNKILEMNTGSHKDKNMDTIENVMLPYS